MYKSLDEIIKIYGINEYDWLNFKITKDNKLTYHHLIKKENGGRHGVSNGAPLTVLGHNYLHQMEATDYDLFIELNNILKRINESGAPINEFDREQIEHILSFFEDKHEDKLLKKYSKIVFNKRLIQEIIDNGNCIRLYKTSEECIKSPTAIRIIMQQGVVIKVPKDKVKKKRKKKKRR